MNERGAPARCFLGWDRPLLDAASDWLCERGDELAELLVALPASRAARGLAARLARRRGPAARPPRVLTIGVLTDLLLRIDARVASRMTRTLAWQRALQSLPDDEIRRLVPRPPPARDLIGWTRLAESVRTLFGELAAEGRSFEDAAEKAAALEGEAERWRALARAQARMRTLLAEHGLADPHLARLAALEREAIDPARRVVLVGLADLNGLQRGVLEALGERATALVFAPPELAESFDALGCLRPRAWRERRVPLPLERWLVADRPEDQARAAARAVACAPRRFAAHELAIGLARPELAPYLQRRFGESQIALRDGSGTPLETSAPAVLLAAAARALDGWKSADYAELARHPDLERALRSADEPLADLDAYRREHVPPRAGAEWLGVDERGLRRRERLAEAHARLLALLGDLASDDARPLGAWAEPARAFLGAVYEAVDLDRPGEHALAGSLARIGELLSELEELPPTLAPACAAHAALAFFARALRGERVPPAPADPATPTVEMLGWLELALDPAPALVVTGFEEGAVPDSPRGDAFLPDALRRALGLFDDERRCARDAYAIEAIQASRKHVAFVTGRRGAANDPQSPSRLAFQCPPEEAVERVRHVLRAAERSARAAPAAPAASPRRELPRRAPIRAPEVWPVTAFGEYLRSPYLFYVRHVLGVDTVDDDAREMDGGVFGDLAHDVLEQFGRSELRDAADADVIARFLAAELARSARQRLGDAPYPAVALQIEQLGWRLQRFAAHQARRARAGWRIVHAEWRPASQRVPFDVDGEPILLSGRIDRIDHHAEHGFAIFDYKTGDGARLEPTKAHLARDGGWRELQLPLYCMLAAELDMGSLPVVGYALLGKDEARIGFQELKGWADELLESACEAAREVVRKVRRGELFEVGDPVAPEPVLAALLGRGLLEADGEGDDEVEEGLDER